MANGKVRLTLQRGDPGTKRYVDRFGEKLLAVRYRYDAEAGRRYTTVELVVDECRWTPQPPVPDSERLVGLRVGYEEETVRRAVRAAGGFWDAPTRLWWIPLHCAVQLKLESRIAPQSPPARLLISRSR